MHRLIRPLIAAALLFASAPLSSASGAEPGNDDLRACTAAGKRVEIRKDKWKRISAPKMGLGEGDEVIVDYTTPPKTRSRIYMTNGRLLKVSDNAGCTWSPMFTGTAQRERRPGIEYDSFTHLAAPDEESLYAASYDEIGDGVYRPNVWAAVDLDDGNPADADFSKIEQNMPLYGKPVALAPALNAEGVVYLLVEGEPDPTAPDPTAPVRRLYVTRVQADPPITALVLGLGWDHVPLPEGFSFVDGIQPGTGRGIWAWQGTKYAYLPDSHGDEPTWAVHDVAATVKDATRIVTIDVAGSGTTTVVVDTPQGSLAAKVAGPDLVRSALPTKATSFTHGGGRNVYVVSGQRGTFGYDVYLQRWIDITPKGVGPFDKVIMPKGGVDRIVLGRAGDALYRFDTYRGEAFVEPPKGKIGFGDWRKLLPKRDLTMPEFVVGDEDADPHLERITVEPGVTEDIPVTLRVPANSTPLDVYFLIDTTSSMQASINGLKENIGNISESLRNALGKDACFGLAEIKDYEGLLAPSPYTRRLPITCDDPVKAIRDSMEGMNSGGGGDIPEAQTTGLVASVRGTMTAKFRPEAFKVIVLVSDSSFKEGGQHPTIDQAIEELNVDDVKVVSVLVGGNGDPEEARIHMDAVATGTSTYAPAQGVDCDGDGRRNPWDLVADAPLVCDISGGSLALGPAIIGLLLGVADPGTLAVDVQDEENVVVEPIKGTTTAIKNLKQQSYLTFAMPVRCRKEQDGQDLNVLLTPTIRAQPLVIKGYEIQGMAVVQCRSVPVVPPRVPPPPPDPEIIEPPRPAKPPIALALPQPPPAPAQPISNINLNAGLSQEEEQQYQLAAVTQGAGEEFQDDESLELAMSDYRARDAAAAGFVLAGTSFMTAAAAAAYRRRLRLQRASGAGYVRSR